MSLLDAARAAADRALVEHREEMQRKLASLLRSVLGEDHAAQARYLGRGTDVLAEIEGLYFAEFRNALHVYVGLWDTERPWDGERAYQAVASLSKLGNWTDAALRASEKQRPCLAQYKALPELPPLPGESAGEPE